MSAAGEISNADVRVEFLTVRVGDERYAVEVGNVGRLTSFDPTEATRVPNTSGMVAGVTAVDGDVTAVIDPRGSAGDAFSGDARLVVFEREGRPVGLAVDELVGIETHPTENIGPATETTARIEDRWVAAVIVDGRSRIAVVDPSRLVVAVDT